MQLSDATLYVTTLFVLTLTPGPLVLMLMVRAASNDTRGAIGFGLGVAAGDVVIIVLICLGLSSWLGTLPGFDDLSKGALLVYVGWLAGSVWNGEFDLSANAKPSQQGKGSIASFVAGLSTCFISPQTIAVYTLLLPTLLNLETAGQSEFLWVAMLTFTALIACFIVVIGFAKQVRRLVSSNSNSILFNRTLSCTLVVACMWMVVG